MTPQEQSDAGQKSPDGLSPIEFQEKRRRKEHQCVMPLSGLGPTGNFTMYLPSPKVERRVLFEGGKSRPIITDSCLDDPNIAALRDKVLSSFVVEGPGLLSVDIAFMDYAAAVLLKNYDLSDVDLGFLLSGEKWQNQMVAHVCGGPDLISALERLAPRLGRQPAPPVHEALIMAAAIRPSLWQRIRRRLFGGE